MDKEFKPTLNITEFSNKKLGELVEYTEDSLIEINENYKKEESNLDDDFEDVRENIKNIVEKGNSLLDNILELAKCSDSPRAFEVAGNLINTLVESNKKLLELHQTKNKIKSETKQESKPEAQTNIQNNTVFVGSTKDFQDLMRKKLDDK